MPDGAGLHSAFDHVARREQNVTAPAAVFDAHGGHAAATLLADYKRAVSERLIKRSPFAVQHWHVIDQHRIDRQALLDDGRGNFNAVEVSCQFGHVPIGRGPLRGYGIDCK